MNKNLGMGVWNVLQLMMLCVFFITVASRSISLRVKRKFNPIKFNFWEDPFLGLLEISMFVAVSIWAIEVMFYSIPSKIQIFPWPFNMVLINGVLAKLSGILISFLGFFLLFSGLKNLGDSWRFGIDENRIGELVTEGIYGFTRNPIYLFFNFWFLGAFLINGTLIFLCFMLFSFTNLHFQILKEEGFLSKVHGTKFTDYCERTPRYFSLRFFLRRRKMVAQISSKSMGK